MLNQATPAVNSRAAEAGPRVLHMTTAHYANDLRIYGKECRSLAEVGGYQVWIAGSGSLPPESTIEHIPLRARSTNRVSRVLKGSVRASALAATVDFDVLHIHDPELIPVGIAAGRLGKRVIWDSHEDYFLRFERGGHGIVGGLRSPMSALLKEMDRSASGIVAATPSIAARYTNDVVAVVGNEARLDDFRRCAPVPTSRQVLFTGSPTSYHLFPEIAEAVYGLPDLTLAVAGKDHTSNALVHAKSLLGDRLRWLGWLDRSALASAMSESLVGCATLEDSAIGVDNSSNKVFEFAAGGLPCLFSPNPSNIEHLRTGDQGYLATGFSASAIKDALQAAVADEGIWKQRSLNARNWAAEFGSWTRSEDALLRLYEAVTRRPPARARTAKASRAGR